MKTLLMMAVLFFWAAPEAAAHYLPPVRPAWGVDVQIVVNGRVLPASGSGSYRSVRGRVGQAYAIRIVNRSRRWIEVVASVDGLDVIDGDTGDLVGKRGYVLEPGITYDIEGWRRDMHTVEAFRFVPAHASEAARRGRPRGRVGMIQVAVYYGSHGPIGPIHPRGYLGGDVSKRDRAEESADEVAPASKGRAKSAPRCTRCPHPWPRPNRLGTARGEDLNAPASETVFRRDRWSRPDHSFTIHYRGRGHFHRR